MKQTTLIYVFNTQWQILLCSKKKSDSWFSVSVGKRNWAGGKIDDHETAIQWAIRELKEETGIQASEQQLIESWILHFSFESKKDRDQECTVFCFREYEWSFNETDEMKPQWFDLDKIPYENMRADDKHRMPFLLDNKFFEFSIHANDDGSEHTYLQIKP